MSEDEDIERLRKACADLGEFFDNVQIFAARQEVEGTVNVNWGSGNWFARYGQVRQWVVKEDQRAKAEVDDDE